VFINKKSNPSHPPLKLRGGEGGVMSKGGEGELFSLNNTAMRSHINNKGVTLVEVMISLVIFLIVFMGLMQTALLSIDGNVRNVERDEAIAIANGEIDNLKIVPFGTLTTPNPPCRTVSRNFRNISKQFNLCDTITDLPDPDGTVKTKSIAVVVGWDHKKETAAQLPTNREFQHSITTLRRSS
jgi:prepilin-type N-terminal cleavage/methylation domain-containing protein